MRDIQRAVTTGLFLGLLGLFLIPAAYLAVRIGDTWTQRYTEQMLGAVTALCGGGLILIALLVGAGLYVKLSGGRISRQEPIPEPPVVLDVPTWTPIPAPEPTPPWGFTGGGRYDLLPPPDDQQRFHFEVKR